MRFERMTIALKVHYYKNNCLTNNNLEIGFTFANQIKQNTGFIETVKITEAT